MNPKSRIRKSNGDWWETKHIGDGHFAIRAFRNWKLAIAWVTACRPVKMTAKD